MDGLEQQADNYTNQCFKLTDHTCNIHVKKQMPWYETQLVGINRINWMSGKLRINWFWVDMIPLVFVVKISFVIDFIVKMVIAYS